MTKKPAAENRRLTTENRTLKQQLAIAQTTTGTPEIDTLIVIYKQATWLSDPLHATQLDTTRSPTYDYLTDTAHTTREGATTYRDRRYLDQLKADITELTNRWRNKLDRTTRPPKDDRPRCWIRTDKHRRGLTLPYGSTICSVCLTELKDDE